MNKRTLTGLNFIIGISVFSSIVNSIFKLSQGAILSGLTPLIHLPLSYALNLRLNWARIVRIVLSVLGFLGIAGLFILYFIGRAPELPVWFLILLSLNFVFEVWVTIYLVSEDVKEEFTMKRYEVYPGEGSGQS